MHRLHALVNWPKRHRVGCLLLLLVYLGLCFIRPVTFSLTHLSARTCGTLDTGDFESPIAVQQQAARCIVQAHQQCQPATLQVTIHAVDRFAQTTLATANAFGGYQLSIDGPSRFLILDIVNSLFPLNVLFPTGATWQSLDLQPTGLVLQGGESGGAGLWAGSVAPLGTPTPLIASPLPC